MVESTPVRRRAAISCAVPRSIHSSSVVTTGGELTRLVAETGGGGITGGGCTVNFTRGN